MPELAVTGEQPFVIGATGMDALLQNLRVIILTAAYSVPLDRGFAHLMDMVDSPSPLETARLSAALVEALERHEPRIRVENIQWLPADAAKGLEGRLSPKITFAVREGVTL